MVKILSLTFKVDLRLKKTVFRKTHKKKQSFLSSKQQNKLWTVNYSTVNTMSSS